MIRIHVLLLASLLSIWGLTSCENSDTDKVNSYNLEVNLSQNVFRISKQPKITRNIQA